MGTAAPPGPGTARGLGTGERGREDRGRGARTGRRKRPALQRAGRARHRTVGPGGPAERKGRGQEAARPLPASPRPRPEVPPPMTSLPRPAGAILKVESPALAAAAAVAVVAAAAAAGGRARTGKPLSETHHPAGSSARPSFLLPRPPTPTPTGAIRRHPPSLPPHPQVRGVSSGSGDPEAPSRVTICSATWQVKEKSPSATDKAPLPFSSLRHPLATAEPLGEPRAPRVSGNWSSGVRCRGRGALRGQWSL